MNPFSKSDLHYQNRYSWNSEKGMNFSRPPFAEKTVFNRHEGLEVLGLINKLMQLNHLSNIQSVEKIETMLINLPFEKQTHRQVSEWIMNYWNKKVPYPNDSLVLVT